MSPDELRLLAALIGVISAFVGAITSAIIFLWLEGRRKYISQLTGLRVVALSAEAFRAAIMRAHSDAADIRLDWFVQHADAVFRSEQAFNVVRTLIELRYEVQQAAVNSGSFDRNSYGAKAGAIRDEILALIMQHSKGLRKYWFLSA